ncbi:thiamine phosphate synthase [Dyella sp.]|jgi:thiamine-phosphate pyrophosphorylase|uniref:thiamine phosphate synthase n=1 Tax=Dyella sp. TaxID=1869338 RepID=UPI002D773D71|nr:thiamine phosphate synthase [Dyella sp.]HET6430732.1 thiamine phosphate synthase [Dyella sp.]
MKTFPPRGIYLITDGSGDKLVDKVEQALAGGVVLVQYRDLTSDASRRYAEASALATLCARHGVPLIIDHDVALARAVGADGVHMSQGDGDPARAREALGRQAIIGVSCHGSAELARAAASAGADYVSFGAFFSSPTKPHAGRSSLDVLRETAALGVPRVAIGGITAENGRLLVDAGADFLASVSSILAAADVCQAARAMTALYP